MSNNFFSNRQNPDAMEIEDVGPHDYTHNTNRRRENLRNRREKTSNDRMIEEDITTTTDEGNGSVNQIYCTFCENPFLINNYNEHVNECPRRPSTQVQVLSQNTYHNDSTNIEADEGQLIVRRPNITRPFNSFAIRRTGRRPNIINSFRNPLTNPHRDEEIPTFPLPSSPLPVNIPGDTNASPLSEHHPVINTVDESPMDEESNIEAQSHPNINSQQIEQPEQPEEPVPAAQDALEANLERYPGGAMIIRTVHPGPNGTSTVRVRVIPINDILNGVANSNAGEGGNQQEGVGLFRALVSLLSGGQGEDRFNLANLFDLIHEERGLEKEVLDSLPLVTYKEDLFKNVEEESKSCPICLDHFEEGNEIRYLWCIHRFHKNCVDTWLDKHTNCPICKKDYSDLERNNFE